MVIGSHILWELWADVSECVCVRVCACVCVRVCMYGGMEGYNVTLDNLTI